MLCDVERRGVAYEVRLLQADVWSAGVVLLECLCGFRRNGTEPGFLPPAACLLRSGSGGSVCHKNPFLRGRITIAFCASRVL